MQNIRSAAGLKDTIRLLEIEQTLKKQLLKEQFHQTYESLKPVNLLKSTLEDISSAPYLTDNILSSAIGFVSGYLSKKFIVGSSGNIFRRLFGNIVQISIINLIAQNPERIKRIGWYILQQIVNTKETNSKNS
ncbi:MAG: hypothetical protein JXJ22_04940 [Bacteroidales bacterium]|nr:hypothetical protein [Bacteroidales bacterium]